MFPTTSPLAADTCHQGKVHSHDDAARQIDGHLWRCISHSKGGSIHSPLEMNSTQKQI